MALVVPSGDAAPAVGEPGNQTPLRKDKVVTICCGLLLAAVVALIVLGYVFGPRGGEALFLVSATEPSGLDPAHSPVIHPSFGLTLRVDNPWFKDCWENITVTVFYGNTIVGWGAVPDFCAGLRTSMEVNVAMSHTDVVLSDELRGFMASQLSTGELEFNVEIRMLLSKAYMGLSCQSCASRQGFLLCDVNPGRQTYAPCQLVNLVH